MMGDHTTPATNTGALSEIEPQAFADWVAFAKGEADAPAEAKRKYPLLISNFVRLRGHANQDGL